MLMIFKKKIIIKIFLVIEIIYMFYNIINMCGVTRKDRIRNDYIRGSVGVADIKDKMRENRLRWFGHVVRGEERETVRKVLSMNLGVKRERGRPKQYWELVFRQDMKKCSVREGVAMDRTEWRARTRTADPK